MPLEWVKLAENRCKSGWAPAGGLFPGLFLADLGRERNENSGFPILPHPLKKLKSQIDCFGATVPVVERAGAARPLWTRR